MTPVQQQILDTITNNLTQKGVSEFVYCSEYLGYLPYGQYHWITCDGDDITKELPFEFSKDDLKKLEKLGEIRITEKWINPKDDTESKTTYELTNVHENN